MDDDKQPEIRIEKEKKPVTETNRQRLGWKLR